MIKVSFECDWGKNSKELLERYRFQTPDNACRWKNILGVESHEQADIVVVLDDCNVDLPSTMPTLQITREPAFIKQVDTNKYHHSHTWVNGFCGLTWWLDYSYDQLIDMRPPEKKSLLSCIVSGKHQHRIDMLKDHVNQLLDSDVSSEFSLFGRGLRKDEWGSVYKGMLNSNGNCKWAGLAEFQASIVMENSSQQNYWTEKLGDALLAWSRPIYWGCPNIKDFFPNATLELSELKHVHTTKQLEEFLQQVSIKDLSSARLKALNDFNLWEVVYEQVSRIL